MQQKLVPRLSFSSTLVIIVFVLSPFASVTQFLNTSPASTHKLVAQAKDGEDDSNDDDKDEDKDDDKDKAKEAEKQEKERKKEQEKAAKEAAKKKVEVERELLKKKLEVMKEKSGIDDDDLNDDSNGTDEDDSASGDDTKEFEKKKVKIIDDIYEDIFDAAQRIEQARIEGVDVTKALATLEEARAKAKLAEASLSNTDLETAKRLAKEVKKLAHFARNNDVHDARDIAKDVSKVEKRLTQTEGKIFLLGTLGGDTSAFTTSLETLAAEFTTLKEAITAGGDGLTLALSQLEALERRIKKLKSSVENAIYALGGTDEKLDDDYSDEAEDFSEHLNDLAEIEGDEVGTKLQRVAATQKVAAQKVGKAAQNIDERNRVLQFLFGTNSSDLDTLRTEVASNQEQLGVLTDARQKIEDPELQAILDDQIESLRGETTKLESFIAGQENRLSVFGWLFNLFPR